MLRLVIIYFLYDMSVKLLCCIINNNVKILYSCDKISFICIHIKSILEAYQIENHNKNKNVVDMDYIFGYEI